MSVLAVDAGTTGVTALVVTRDGRVAARGYQEFPQHFPAPGWVEHVPEEIWQATLQAARTALDAAALAGVEPVQLRRPHQPTGDRRAVGPHAPVLPAARDRLAGPAQRRRSARACRTRATNHGSRN